MTVKRFEYWFFGHLLKSYIRPQLGHMDRSLEFWTFSLTPSETSHPHPYAHTHTHTHTGMEKLKATVWKCKQASCSLAEVTEGVLKELFPFIFSRMSLFTFKRTPETGVVTELYLGLCSHTERRKINFSPRRTGWLVQEVIQCQPGSTGGGRILVRTASLHIQRMRRWPGDSRCHRGRERRGLYKPLDEY